MKTRSGIVSFPLRGAAVLFGMAFSLSAVMVEAQTPYYADKSINIVIGSRVGGGTDTAARITARLLPKYIPGNPRIIVRNMPGGGGAIAGNIFYHKAKPNGLELLQASSGAMGLQLRGRDIVKFDFLKMPTIGHIARGGNVLVVRKLALPRLADSSANPVVVGTQEGEESWQAMTLWGKEFLGWNLRWIPGYTGGSDMALAFERGEIDVYSPSSAADINRYLESGEFVGLTQQGMLGGNHQFRRRPDFPDVPTFIETLGDKKPTGFAWQAYLSFTGTTFVDKFLCLPPGTPETYVATLTAAFASMAKDPQFDTFVKRMLSEVYDVGVGRETVQLLKMVLDVPQEAKDYSKTLQHKFGIN
ncbi:MAG: tripartite tricarboxylate transporter substrate-binding protein [Desulfobacterales bacterium]|nr:tripartite tricarboxylate transporter substrate-binding protein [Desulfobacterales bacterium]